jgi:DNA-binding CsgD family transcriptional regulator
MRCSRPTTDKHPAAKRLKALWKRGVRADVIAKELGYAVGTIKTMACDLGLPRRFNPGPKKSPFWTKKLDAKLKKYVAAGLTYKEIATKLKMDVNAVQRHGRWTLGLHKYPGRIHPLDALSEVETKKFIALWTGDKSIEEIRLSFPFEAHLLFLKAKQLGIKRLHYKTRFKNSRAKK